MQNHLPCVDQLRDVASNSLLRQVWKRTIPHTYMSVHMHTISGLVASNAALVLAHSRRMFWERLQASLHARKSTSFPLGTIARQLLAVISRLRQTFQLQALSFPLAFGDLLPASRSAALTLRSSRVAIDF